MVLLSIFTSDKEHLFVGVNAILFIIVVLLCLSLSIILKKAKFHYLPDSSASMLFGMLVGIAILIFGSHSTDFVMFKNEVFFYVLLPPIIFDAGYSMEKQQFFSNMSTILLLAVFGTVLSTGIIGFSLYRLAQYGLVDLDVNDPLESLIFGALISAVDPVATLSILNNSHVNADSLLSSLVFGESVLNDAVSIVLFKYVTLVLSLCIFLCQSSVFSRLLHLLSYSHAPSHIHIAP